MYNKEYIEDAIVISDEEEDKQFINTNSSVQKTVKKDAIKNKKPKKLYKKGRKTDVTSNLIPNEVGSNYHLLYFEGIKKFQSVFRAMRRGRVGINGEIYPKRPFNNRKVLNNRSIKCRPINELKKTIHNDIKQHRAYLASQSV